MGARVVPTSLLQQGHPTAHGTGMHPEGSGLSLVEETPPCHAKQRWGFSLCLCVSLLQVQRKRGAWPARWGQWGCPVTALPVRARSRLWDHSLGSTSPGKSGYRAGPGGDEPLHCLCARICLSQAKQPVLDPVSVCCHVSGVFFLIFLYTKWGSCAGIAWLSFPCHCRAFGHRWQFVSFVS